MNHPFMPLFSVILPMLQSLSIYAAEIGCDGIPIHIRNDIRAVPHMNGISDAMSQPIGAVRIIRILYCVACVTILCTKQAIRITCNKRAILMHRKRIAVVIVSIQRVRCPC